VIHEHVTVLLDDYVDGRLDTVRAEAARIHLAVCEECRAEEAWLRTIKAKAGGLPRSLPPQRDLWPEIRELLGAGQKLPSVVRDRAFVFRAAAAVAGVFLAGLGLLLLLSDNSQPSWSVARLSGAPVLASVTLEGEGKIRPGDALETDVSSRARLEVGDIGVVDIFEDSRVVLLSATPSDHRLFLPEGSIHAKIWAPPRLFFVQTPSALAVDLGCEYRLRVDSTGAGLLNVLSGWVSLELHDRRTIVPARMECPIHPLLGPGLPLRPEAPPAFRMAAAAFDVSGDSDAPLKELLRLSRPGDAVTLWYVFRRVPVPLDRQRVYDRLTTLLDPPRSVTRQGTLAGDTVMIRVWEQFLNLDPFPD
jgi:hypothetical protein